VDSIGSHGIKVVMRQVHHMRSAAFYRTCKAGIILTGTGRRHWLILSSQRIKMNGQERIWDAFQGGSEQIIY
jgi:hypothetical protein